MKEPINYDNLCSLVITELIEHDPKWKEMTNPFRLNRYPQYESVYKAIHNVAKRRLKKLNKKIRERQVAENKRSAFEETDSEESESGDNDSSVPYESPQIQVDGNLTSQVTPQQQT